MDACTKKFNTTRKLEYENAQKKAGTPCKYLFEKEKVEFITGTKIDYKPELTCDGKKNVDQY